ncbi:hypothetical protein Bhyg_12369 [Pseudolycoriella hygida]|uniref:SWIM-type domain-containing protein n=1 Tax=Pseudolycoriella hygida TaxID=35572 RepID=A0A9Q0MX40_9DIPT|nr:hypothetical protein Bhyg_12369 [Pseudolycoriella hygida]
MEADAKIRYDQKVKDFCGGIDPFTLTVAKCPLPRNVAYFDICNYCIEKDSSYTHESFKAYKCLDAYQYYENGWVQSLLCKKIDTGSIILARVKHSCRLSLKALRCWVAVDNVGIVLTGHCECMSGQGEVCRHVGAILFTLEAWGRKSNELDHADSISCTDVLNKWLVPKMSNVEMAAVENICWTSSPNLADTQDVSLRTSTDGFDNTLEESIAFNGNDADIQDMIDSFLHKIKECGVLCPIMAMRAPFSSDFVVKKQEHLLLDLASDEAECELSVIRLYLTALFEPAYKSLPLDELRAIANDFSLTYTRNEIDFIE